MAITRYLGHCRLAAKTVKAYGRHCRAYVGWLSQYTDEHPTAFANIADAEAAVIAWRRHLIGNQYSPASINQALAGVTLMYEHAVQLRIHVKHPRMEPPGEPLVLTRQQQDSIEQAAARRGPRDAAIIAVLLYTGARAEECARLDIRDLVITATAWTVRLHGRRDEVRTVPLPAVARDRISAWLLRRGDLPGPLWPGQRGPLTVSGISQVVLAVGSDASLEGLRPHRLRHTYGTRLRQGKASPQQVQALMGHSSSGSTARYFRPDPAELTAAVREAFANSNPT